MSAAQDAPPALTEGAPVEVAVGVMIRADGAFLIACRPLGKPMAGYWEFPGGKIEAGESVFAALRREFMEELGITVTGATPWAERVFVYPHATVRLHFWRIHAWQGEPRSLEGQALSWERIDALTAEPWLPGALPLRRWLDLPDAYALSAAGIMGVPAFLQALDAQLARGAVRMLLLREPGMGAQALRELFDAVRSRTRAAGVRLLVSSRHADLANEADGLHLTGADLAACAKRPSYPWCLASCHDAAGIARAGQLGLDAVVLGPVLPTASHPGAPGLGWDGFAAAVRGTTLPVYALGGLQAGDLENARRHGAHGVALLRAAWAQLS